MRDIAKTEQKKRSIKLHLRLQRSINGDKIHWKKSMSSKKGTKRSEVKGSDISNLLNNLFKHVQPIMYSESLV